MAELLPTHTPELFDSAVRRAAAALREGELVVLPTETVYGLAANALDAGAVARIFEAKGRPAHNPIIVHVTGLEMARRCASLWPDDAQKLGAAFWPGPLTLVVPSAKDIPAIVTAGGPTVGIRWPSHPFIQAVIRACGFPLAAPSANRSGEISPTTAAHAQSSLGGAVSVIVDGGQCHFGIESTVVDVIERPARLLRPGMIQAGAVAAVLGQKGLLRGSGGAVLRSPGLLRKHYAPKARLVVLSWKDESDLAAQTAQIPAPLADIHVIAHTHIPLGEKFGRVAVMPHDAEAFARALYAEMRQCDASEAKWIIVEAPPEDPAWQGIADRLSRASSE